MKEVFSSSFLSENISGTAVGAISGFLLKKLLVGSSGGIIRKLLGTVLQLGITNIASNKTDAIKSIGHSIIQKIFHKRKKESEGVS
jgi:F0F1-type ATP synthase assembly protein I